MEYQTQGFHQLFPQAVADGVTGSRALKGAGFSNLAGAWRKSPATSSICAGYFSCSSTTHPPPPQGRRYRDEIVLRLLYNFLLGGREEKIKQESQLVGSTVSGKRFYRRRYTASNLCWMKSLQTFTTGKTRKTRTHYVSVSLSRTLSRTKLEGDC